MNKHYYLFSDIYEESIKDFALFCESIQSGDHVIIHITSYGGEAFSAVAAVNIIRRLQNDNVTFRADVMGMCASAATIIACACNTIDMCPNAMLMFHSAIGPDIDVVNKINSVQRELLVSRGIDEKMINILLDENASNIDAETALKTGLCNNIVQIGVDDMKSIQVAAFVQKNGRYTDMEENKILEEKEERREEVLSEEDDKTTCEGEDLLSMIEGLAKAVEEIRDRIDRLEARGDDRDDSLKEKIDEVVEARARKVKAQIMNLCGAPAKKRANTSDKASADAQIKAEYERSKKMFSGVKLPY